MLGDQARLLRKHAWRYVDGLSDEELHFEPALHSAEIGTMRHLWRATR